MPEPLTDRELLIARLVLVDTLNTVLELARGGMSIEKYCLLALDRYPEHTLRVRAEKLLAEHERIEAFRAT